MSDMTSELLELAERCENAMGPDAEADYLIHALVMGWRIPDEINCFTWCVGENYQFGHPDDQRRAIYISESELPNYTASLDAAMTLVPEGWDWTAQTSHRKAKARANCDLTQEAPFKPEDWKVTTARAATPALALCAAALRAIATTSTENG